MFLGVPGRVFLHLWFISNKNTLNFKINHNPPYNHELLVQPLAAEMRVGNKHTFEQNWNGRRFMNIDCIHCNLKMGLLHKWCKVKKTVVKLFQTVYFVNCVTFLQMMLQNSNYSNYSFFYNVGLGTKQHLNVSEFVQYLAFHPLTFITLQMHRKTNSIQNWHQCHFQTWKIQRLQF